MHSLNYLLYTCKHLSSYDKTPSKKVRLCAQTRASCGVFPIISARPASLLTWSSIRHSGCGKNSCTATGRSSLETQVHLWPRRGPGGRRRTFWPSFTHTQLVYVRPRLRLLSLTRVACSCIYTNIICMALPRRFAVP